MEIEDSAEAHQGPGSAVCWSETVSVRELKDASLNDASIGSQKTALGSPFR